MGDQNGGTSSAVGVEEGSIPADGRPVESVGAESFDPDDSLAKPLCDTKYSSSRRIIRIRRIDPASSGIISWEDVIEPLYQFLVGFVAGDTVCEDRATRAAGEGPRL